MKQKWSMLVLVLAGIICLGCGDGLSRAPSDTPAPVRTLRPTFTPMPSATNTPLPTSTPEPTSTPLPTNTPLPPTDTSEPPTLEPSPTNTSEPPTLTPVPPTATRQPVKRTAVPPTPTPTPVPVAKHVEGSHGVSGLVIARDKTTFRVGEKAFFTYEALNYTKDPIGFEKLGLKASNGLFNTSWVNPDVILPDVPFKHDDGLIFDTPGTYRVMLAICFARCEESDADWEEFPHGAATVTVK